VKGLKKTALNKSAKIQKGELGRSISAWANFACLVKCVHVAV
jgi:hypothetical protein